MKLQEGIYEISTDVRNPKPDRRTAKRNFSAWEVWPKGMRVMVMPDFDFPDLVTVYPPNGYQHLGVRGRPGGNRNHPGWEALIAALKPVEMTDLEWVKHKVPMHEHVLAELLSSGKLTKADIEDAARKVNEREE